MGVLATWVRAAISHCRPATQPEANAALIAPPSANDAVQDWPENVHKSPRDLPDYDQVVSGTGKDALIKLSTDQAGMMVVITKKNVAYMVASTKLYKTALAAQLISQVRQHLHLRNFEQPQLLWATPSLVTDLNRLTVNAQTKHAALTEMDAKATPQWQRFLAWIDYGFRINASDIHVEVRGTDAFIRFRVNGDMELLKDNESNGEILAQPARESVAMSFNFASENGTATGSNFNSNEQLEWIVTLDRHGNQVKLRCESVPMLGGFDFIARFSHKNKNYTYDTFGYLPWHQAVIRDAVERGKGIIILAGVPNSGKSSAVQMIVGELAKNTKIKAISAEAPVEKAMEGVSQMLLAVDESNEEKSLKTFNSAIQKIVRSNPDILFMGEIRSASSANTAITMGEAGNLLFSTIHAASPLGIFQRLISLNVDIYALTAPDIMNLFIHQTLVQVLCDQCKIPLDQMTNEVQSAMRHTGHRLEVPVDGMYYRAEQSNCPSCRGTGVSGQTVVCEMMPHDSVLLDLVMRRELLAAQRHWESRSDGRYDTENFDGKSSFYHAFILAQRGVISPDAVLPFGKFKDFPAPSARSSCVPTIAPVHPVAHGDNVKRMYP